MSSVTKILLDLDGVIIPSQMAIFAHYHVPLSSEDDYPDDFLWDIKGAVNHYRETEGMGPVGAYFWSDLDYDFWRNLPMYPTAHNFVEWLHGGLEVLFCTSATSGEMAAARYDWVKEHFPEKEKSLIITQHKHTLADIPGAILIDDRDENVAGFRAAGGQAILVPKPWNKGCDPNEYHPATYERRPVYNFVAKQLIDMVGT